VTVLLGLLSSMMWGASDFLGGFVSRRRSPIAVVAWAETLGFLLCTVALVVTGSWGAPYGWLFWGILAGAAGCTGLGCYYAALASGTMGVVSPIASLGVVIPVLVGFLGGDAPALWQVLGIGVAIVGIVLTSGPELSGGAAARPVLLAAISGFLFGLFFVAMNRGVDDGTLLTLWAMRAGVTAFFVCVAVVRRSLGSMQVSDLRLLAFVALGDLLANLFFGIASTRGYLSITSVLSSLYPVFTVLLARVVLDERLRRIQAAGVLVTMAGVVLISSP
jgi:drug/metabolite transporter (DMT)-like permease